MSWSRNLPDSLQAIIDSLEDLLNFGVIELRTAEVQVLQGTARVNSRLIVCVKNLDKCCLFCTGRKCVHVNIVQ